MKVIVSGIVVETSIIHSDKRKCDIGVVTLYSGGEAVKVYNFPLDKCDLLTLYKPADIPCRLFEGRKGIGFVYDE